MITKDTRDPYNQDIYINNMTMCKLLPYEQITNVKRVSIQLDFILTVTLYIGI